MSPEEIEGYINKICWGGKFAFIENEESIPQTIIIKSLSLKDRNFVEFIYNEGVREAVDNDILTKFELQNQLKVKGIWDEEDDKSLKASKERLGELLDSIKGLKKSTRKYKIMDRLLSAFKKNYSELAWHKSLCFSVCAEEYALDLKNAAIVFCSTFNEHEKRVWDTYSDFLNETDVALVRNIIHEINKFEPVEQKNMRYIARSPQWRFRWNAGKTHGHLFDGTLLELDAEQQNLVYWSQVYDSVYEAYERPSDDIIENDEKLDEWFDNEKRKDNVKRIEEGKGATGINVSSNVGRHGEIFIVANPDINPNAPTTQAIEELNTSFVRKFKNKEQEIIKDKKIINEKDLRARHNLIARKLIGSSESVVSKTDLGGRSKKADRKTYPGGTIGSSGKQFNSGL